MGHVNIELRKRLETRKIVLLYLLIAKLTIKKGIKSGKL